MEKWELSEDEEKLLNVYRDILLHRHGQFHVEIKETKKKDYAVQSIIHEGKSWQFLKTEEDLERLRKIVK